MKNNTFKTGVPFFWYSPKLLLIMKLIIVIMTAFLFQASASSFAQRITLNEKNTPFKKVLAKIRQQSGFDFIGTTDVIKSSKPVRIQVNNVTLEEALNILFAEQDLNYLIQDKAVVIRKKSLLNKLTDFVGSNFQDMIRGKVVDESGKPLPGATIKIKGNGDGKSYSTTENGNFSIPLNTNGVTVLVVSYIGYKSKEVSVSSRDKELLISLDLQSGQLEEVSVVSTGYQSLPKERATGSFEKIDNNLFNRNVSTDIISRLEGLTSSVLFDRRQNRTANAAGMSIRGLSTLYANTVPLIVLDNFPYDGDINNINPNDIESITLLKDAAASSIWGVRAGNGVLVITTKKGKFEQPLKLALNTNLTIEEKPDLFKNKSISTSSYIDVEKFLYEKGYYQNDINNSSFSLLSPVVELLRENSPTANAKIDALRQYDVRNDFLRYIYREPIRQQYSLSLSQGHKSFSYMISGGYDKNLNNTVDNVQDRITLRSNTTFKPLKAIEIQTNILYTKNRQEKTGSKSGIEYGSIRSSNDKYLFPYSRLANDDGTPLSIGKDYRTDFVETTGNGLLLDWTYNPLAEINQSSNTTKSEDLLLNFNTRYQISQVFSADLRYQYEKQNGITNNIQRQGSYFTRDLINRYTQINGNQVSRPIPLGSIVDKTSFDLSSYNVRGQLNFGQIWNQKHELNAIAGLELRQNQSASNVYSSYGFNEDLLTFQNVDLTTSFPIYEGIGFNSSIPNNNFFSESLLRYTSIYANGAYTYDNRYTISASARKDASNLFGVKSNQKGVPLWSTGLNWNISNEHYYRIQWLPYLKLRVTYGYGGNIKNDLSAYTTIRYQKADPTTQLGYAQIVNPPNPSLRWEKVGITNLGLDFGLRNNVLTGTIEYYRKNSKDLIAPIPIESTTGLNSLQTNSANLRTEGFDFTLNSTHKIWRSIAWNSTFILSYSQNKVTRYLQKELTGGSYIASGNTFLITPIEGKSVYSVFAYKYAGLDPNTGDPQGYLNTGEISKNYTALRNTKVSDLQHFGSAIPLYFGSFRNTFSYNSFSISANITYKLNYYFKRSGLNYGSLFANGIGTSDFDNRWQKPGDEMKTNIPSMIYPNNSSRDDFYTKSAAMIEKGDHIRLQDITMTYSFNKPNWKIRNLKLFANLNNVAIIWRANKQGIDPDYNSGIYPATKSTSFGINAEF